MNVQMTKTMMVASWPSSPGRVVELYGLVGEGTMMTATRAGNGRQSGYRVLANAGQYGPLPIRDTAALVAYAERFRASL